jgi:hypothetical protein
LPNLENIVERPKDGENVLERIASGLEDVGDTLFRIAEASEALRKCLVVVGINRVTDEAHRVPDIEC